MKYSAQVILGESINFGIHLRTLTLIPSIKNIIVNNIRSKVPKFDENLYKKLKNEKS